MKLSATKSGHCMIGALGKYHSVKCAVNNISKCACQNKRGTKFKAFMIAFSGKQENINHNTKNSNNTENAKKQFSPLAGKLQPESHAVVFGKIELKPVAHNRHFFAQGKIQFHPNL